MEDEPFLEEQLRVVYTSKSRPPKNSTNEEPKSIFPMIPKEKYDLLSEDVKDVLRQQHAFYKDQIRALHKGSPRHSPLELCTIIIL